jgi:hypothetical protein
VKKAARRGLAGPPALQTAGGRWGNPRFSAGDPSLSSGQASLEWGTSHPAVDCHLSSSLAGPPACCGRWEKLFGQL